MPLPIVARCADCKRLRFVHPLHRVVACAHCDAPCSRRWCAPCSRIERPQLKRDIARRRRGLASGAPWRTAGLVR